MISSSPSACICRSPTFPNASGWDGSDASFDKRAYRSTPSLDRTMHRVGRQNQRIAKRTASDGNDETSLDAARLGQTKRDLEVEIKNLLLGIGEVVEPFRKLLEQIGFIERWDESPYLGGWSHPASLTPVVYSAATRADSSNGREAEDDNKTRGRDCSAGVGGWTGGRHYIEPSAHEQTTWPATAC